MEKKETKQDLNDYQLITLSELEPILKLSHRTLLQYVYDGKLKAVKLGQKWKVKKSDLDNFLKNITTG